jgi:DNA processing protein
VPYNRIFDLALLFVSGLGDINAKKLITAVGSAENIFNLKLKDFLRIPGFGQQKAESIILSLDASLQRAKEEELYCAANEINYVCYTEDDYPQKLKECPDAPLVLFYKGKSDFNKSKILSIVGTRSATRYGVEFTENLVKNISENYPDCVIVSGLAYGIDISAHKSALKYGLETWAVLGHSLEYIYPVSHEKIAKKIIESDGLLLSDYPHKSKIDPSNFAKRNRIIAGLCDALVVVESGEKGGAIITANIANHYNKDVFAVPGNINEPYSKGCNKLIKTNRANLIESLDDIEYIMNWKSKSEKITQQKLNFIEPLNQNETKVFEVLKNYEYLDIDNILRQTELDSDLLSLTLLEMEFKGIIKALPGKIFTLKL